MGYVYMLVVVGIGSSGPLMPLTIAFQLLLAASVTAGDVLISRAITV